MDEQRGAIKVSISFDPDQLAAIEWLRGAAPNGTPMIGNGERSRLMQELIEREMRERFGPKWREGFRARIADGIAA